jgi:hypothetical protein
LVRGVFTQKAGDFTKVYKYRILLRATIILQLPLKNKTIAVDQKLWFKSDCHIINRDDSAVSCQAMPETLDSSLRLYLTKLTFQTPS